MLTWVEVSASKETLQPRKISVGLLSRKCRKSLKAFTTQPPESAKRCLGKLPKFCKMLKRIAKAWEAYREERWLHSKWTLKIFNPSTKEFCLNTKLLSSIPPNCKSAWLRNKTGTSLVSKSTKMWSLTYRLKSESTVLVPWTSSSPRVTTSTYCKESTFMTKNKNRKSTS